ncbi:MAG: PulJ/GspJ family protein [Planctomycetota bacterium]
MKHSPARSSGFTIVEILVAVGIMSLVMTVLVYALHTSLQAREQLENGARVARLGPDLLDIIEGDLRRAWISGLDEDRVFKGEARSMDGESADSLSFLTAVDSTVFRRIEEREVSSDVCETGYRLRRNPLLPDVFELWRRQSFHVDDKPLDEGVYERLHDRVISFQVRYLEALDRYAERRSEWDVAELHRLPAAVEIVLSLEAVARTTEDLDRRADNRRILTYSRIIPLRRDSDLAMRVLALPPSFVGVGAGGPGGSSKAKDEDGDGEPDEGSEGTEGDSASQNNNPTPGGPTEGEGPGAPPSTPGAPPSDDGQINLAEELAKIFGGLGGG